MGWSYDWLGIVWACGWAEGGLHVKAGKTLYACSAGRGWYGIWEFNMPEMLEFIQPNTGFYVASSISRHLGSLAKNEHLLNPVSSYHLKWIHHNPITSQVPWSFSTIHIQIHPERWCWCRLRACGGVFGLSCSFQPTRCPRQDLGVPIHHAIGRLVSLR